MTTESARFHPYTIHPHGEDPALSGPASGRAADAGGAGGDDAPAAGYGRLWREGDMVMYETENLPAAPVRLLWVKPLSGRGGPVSIMAAGKKKEVAYLPDIGVLPEESRRIALEELAGNMILARITAIHSVRPRFGNYYWDVDTTLGRRRFLLTSPENNSMFPAPDMLVVRDSSGNCFEINPVSGLDKHSRIELDRVI